MFCDDDGNEHLCIGHFVFLFQKLCVLKRLENNNDQEDNIDGLILKFS